MAYDLDLFVIGAGSGGVRAARFAADYGARVAIAESRYLGGTCVNVGCVPKKLLMHAAQYRQELTLAESFGWSLQGERFDWAHLIAQKNQEIQRLNQVYGGLLSNSGVQLYAEHARITGAHEVLVDERTLSAQHILIATGGWPIVPDIPGAHLGCTSNEIFFLERLPKRLLVVGGGYIAVELASILNGLGVEVTVMHRGPCLLRGFDQELRTHLYEEMEKTGVRFIPEQSPQAIERIDQETLSVVVQNAQRLETDAVLFAIGRRPMLDNLGLEAVPLERNAQGYLVVNQHYQTTVPSIFAVGDVIGRMPLTPVALAEGMAVARQLFAPEAYRAVAYQNIPTAVFSLPNLATVGLTEEQAIAAGYHVQVFVSRFKPMKLSLSQHTQKTFMKLIVDGCTDLVLGVHMVGPDAAEIIQGLAVALKAGVTKRQCDETMGIHPSAAEEFVTMRQPVRVHIPAGA